MGIASFAQNRRALLCALAVSASLAGCASLPPPTSQVAAAQQAISRASNADADQYAAADLARASDELEQAQAALAAGRNEDALALANSAGADADLAYAASRSQTTLQDYQQRLREVRTLRKQLNVSDGENPAKWAVPMPGSTVGDPAQRLQALDADPQLGSLAAYERLRAHQAVDALATAKKKQLPDALALADKRVTIAQLAAATEATRQLVRQLDQTRSDLLVEASRQDAERARAEAERIRVQSQIQAEEMQRLQDQAAQDAQAREDAETTIQDVSATEAAKLKAAQARQAELARQEAALMAGQDPSAAPAGNTTAPKPKPKPKK